MKEINESIATIDKLVAMAQAELLNLGRHIEQITDGKLTVCAPECINKDIQLYQPFSTTAEEAIKIIKELADDCFIYPRWEEPEDNTICYGFHIDRHPFCIVIRR